MLTLDNYNYFINPTNLSIKSLDRIRFISHFPSFVLRILRVHKTLKNTNVKLAQVLLILKGIQAMVLEKQADLSGRDVKSMIISTNDLLAKLISNHSDYQELFSMADSVPGLKKVVCTGNAIIEETISTCYTILAIFKKHNTRQPGQTSEIAMAASQMSAKTLSSIYAR